MIVIQYTGMVVAQVVMLMALIAFFLNLWGWYSREWGWVQFLGNLAVEVAVVVGAVLADLTLYTAIHAH